MPIQFLSDMNLPIVRNEPMTSTVTSKRGPGRPPTPPEERLNARVAIRLNPADDSALGLAATVAGITKSAFIRRVIRSAANPESM